MRSCIDCMSCQAAAFLWIAATCPGIYARLAPSQWLQPDADALPLPLVVSNSGSATQPRLLLPAAVERRTMRDREAL